LVIDKDLLKKTVRERRDFAKRSDTPGQADSRKAVGAKAPDLNCCVCLTAMEGTTLEERVSGGEGTAN
jgi:hypothetical protein